MAFSCVQRTNPAYFHGIFKVTTNFGKKLRKIVEVSKIVPLHEKKTLQGTKVCRYNWHSAGSLGWLFPMLKYKYIFQRKYTEVILSNNKMLIAF